MKNKNLVIGTVLAIAVLVMSGFWLLHLIQRENRLKSFSCDMGYGNCRVNINRSEKQLKEYYNRPNLYTRKDYESLIEFAQRNIQKSKKRLEKLNKKQSLTEKEKESLNIIKKRLDYYDRLIKVINEIKK